MIDASGDAVPTTDPAQDPEDRVHLDGVGALVSTGYGRLLLVKVVLVGAVLALGARNFKRLTPKLGEAAGRSA